MKNEHNLHVVKNDEVIAEPEEVTKVTLETGKDDPKDLSPDSLPKIGFVQQIVDHVKRGGLQHIDKDDTGISTFGLEIRLRTEGQIPTDIIEAKPELEIKMADQLMASILRGVYDEIHGRVQEARAVLVPIGKLVQEVHPAIYQLEVILDMLMDKDRYWKSELKEREVQEVEVPISDLLQEKENKEDIQIEIEEKENKGEKVNG